MLYGSPEEAKTDIAARAADGRIPQEDAMDVIRSIDAATDYWQEAIDVPREERPERSWQNFPRLLDHLLENDHISVEDDAWARFQFETHTRLDPVEDVPANIVRGEE